MRDIGGYTSSARRLGGSSERRDELDAPALTVAAAEPVAGLVQRRLDVVDRLGLASRCACAAGGATSPKSDPPLNCRPPARSSGGGGASLVPSAKRTDFSARPAPARSFPCRRGRLGCHKVGRSPRRAPARSYSLEERRPRVLQSLWRRRRRRDGPRRHRHDAVRAGCMRAVVAGATAAGCCHRWRQRLVRGPAVLGHRHDARTKPNSEHGRN